MRNRGLCWSGRISYGSFHAYHPKLRASLCPSHAFHPLVRGCRSIAGRRAGRHCAQRHGGGAGGARRADRRRDSGAGRQRGRRRGRDRLRDGGDLSARRQYRRRRLHGDPSRRAAAATSPSTIARPRRRRPRATSSSTRTAMPTRASRATRRSRSACPARWRGWRSRIERYGSGQFTLAQLIAPAITLARDGIPVEDDLADSLPRAQRARSRAGRHRRRFSSSPTAARSAPGDTLVQRDLADTLEAIAHDGPRAFYEGPIADKIAAARAGRRRHHDRARICKDYRPIVRRPVRGTYRGYAHRLDAAVVLRRRGADRDAQHPRRLHARRARRRRRATHLMIEAMKRAYADRAAYLGDPAVVCGADRAADVEALCRDAARAASIPSTRRRRSEIHAEMAPPREGDNTTHFSVVDRYGNAVSNTYTLNFSYGVGLVAEGTGVLLNNELDDFAAKAARAQRLRPGRRRRQRARPRQAAAVVDDADHRAQERPAVPRHRLARRQPHHHRGAADHRQRDRSQDADRRGGRGAAHPSSMVAGRGRGRARAIARSDSRAAARGHKVREGRPATSANSILVTPQGFVGAADPRTRGALAAGY